MTCIVGYVDKIGKRVIIGGDSACTDGSNISSRRDVKVFNKGEFVIGGTSSFRMIQLLMFSFTPPNVNGKEIFEYLCTDFITEVRNVFRDNGYLQKTSSGEDTGGTFLIGYKDRLFRVDNDFHIGEDISEFNAIGCGADFALGSLYANNIREDMTPYDKVLEALRASEFLSEGVRGPFVIKYT